MPPSDPIQVTRIASLGSSRAFFVPSSDSVREVLSIYILPSKSAGEMKGVAPPQKRGSVVLGVDPVTTEPISPTVLTSHPSGTALLISQLLQIAFHHLLSFSHFCIQLFQRHSILIPPAFQLFNHCRVGITRHFTNLVFAVDLCFELIILFTC